MGSCLLARQRKVKKIRRKIKALGAVRLSVHRTSMHIYAQIIAPDGKVLASASSLEKVVKDNPALQATQGKIVVAQFVGKLIAERAKAQITKVAFDRSGFKYHGRVKALADAARESGLSF